MAIINRVSSLLVFFLLFSCSLLHICTSNDTMRIGQSFRDGQTLISQHQQFALGFFSPGTSKKRYLGIWYNKIPIQTVIWIANRENPLSDSSGILSFGDDGNLRILDGRNNTLWFTDTPVVDFKPTLRLLDSGNLILVQTDDDDVFYNSSLTLWQSFDYPSDTGLPGTRLGVNGDSGLNTSLTSWKDSNDPSYGDFTIGVDPYGSFQIFIWEKKRNTKYWRSGHWDWQVYIPLVQMINVYFNGFNLMGDTIFKYSTSNFYMRFVMNSTGTVQLYGWIEESKEWRSYMSQPSDQCQVYGWCGSNGQCNRSSSCECLPGFEPRDVREWGMEDWSSGCFRSRELQCHVNASRSVNDGNGDGFWRLRGMKLPDGSFMLGEVVDVGLCEGRCMKNCSCVAYAFVNGVGCLVWDGDLMDTVKFPTGGQDLYIRLASSELQRLKSNDRGRILLLAMILGACVIGQVLFCACACGYWRWKLRQKDINSSREVARYFSEENNLGEDRIDGGPNLHLFDLETVAVATENFSSSNKLGSGGFGPVYKGKLPGGQRIAVKRLSRNSGQGVVEFKNEVIMISKLQHRNLVKLIGCCIQSEEKMLLYEFMPNKSLDAFIFDPHKRAQLDWRKRLHIIEGIARGLLYLHRDSRLRIIHRDLKASNILLDSEMNPKISDFGMARIFGGNQTEANTNRVMGTYGYMSPEYAMEGLFSEKSDVFSFGVLLLEIISGRKNTSFCNLEQHSSNLVRSAWHLWNEDKETQLMDPFLTDSCSMHEVLRCIHVGLLCVQDAATERPTMRQVLSMLGSEISINLPTPKQIAFSMDRSLTETNSSIRSQDMFSTNEITITSIEGR